MTDQAKLLFVAHLASSKLEQYDKLKMINMDEHGEMIQIYISEGVSASVLKAIGEEFGDPDATVLIDSDVEEYVQLCITNNKYVEELSIDKPCSLELPSEPENKQIS